ncbi:MAG: putative toxin-antitoxin system toxin component, PIN family [Nitrospirota bacterium]
MKYGKCPLILLLGKDTLSSTLQDLWVHREFELATSIEILREVSRVLQYPRIRERFKPKEENIRRFFKLIFRKAIITKDLYSTDRITDDPSDNIFLACALESNADYVVSRDPHLRNLKHFHGVRIIDVKAFVERVRKG